MTKPKITYLLGAGASAFAVPTIRFFPVLLDLFQEDFREVINSSDLGSYDKDAAHSYLNDIEDFSSFATVDTWARKLFLSKSQQYEDIKKIISLFLVYCQFGRVTPILDKFRNKEWVSKYGLYFDQPGMDNFNNMIKRPIDPRYDLFLGSILSHDDSNNLLFPSNIRILSWNYDSQFETSIKTFSSGPIKREDGSQFEVNKLNGSANFSMTSEGKKEPAFVFNYNSKKNWNYQSRIIDILSNKLSPFKKFENQLKFAWEMENKNISDANVAILDTDILVVVGYTFPSFNQEIERKIFQNSNRIRKVYYQIPEEEYDGLIDRLKGTVFSGQESPHYQEETGRGIVEFKNIKDLNQFYIPNEFYL